MYAVIRDGYLLPPSALLQGIRCILVCNCVKITLYEKSLKISFQGRPSRAGWISSIITWEVCRKIVKNVEIVNIVDSSWERCNTTTHQTQIIIRRNKCKNNFFLFVSPCAALSVSLFFRTHFTLYQVSQPHACELRISFLYHYTFFLYTLSRLEPRIIVVIIIVQFASTTRNWRDFLLVTSLARVDSSPVCTELASIWEKNMCVFFSSKDKDWPPRQQKNYK